MWANPRAPPPPSARPMRGRGAGPRGEAWAGVVGRGPGRQAGCQQERHDPRRTRASVQESAHPECPGLSVARSGYNRGVARAFFREGRRLFVRAMHLLGSRTVFFLGLLLAITTGGRRRAEAVVVAHRHDRRGRGGARGGGTDGRLAAPTARAAGARQPGIQTAAAERVYRGRGATSRPAAVVRGARRNCAGTARLYPLGTKVDVVFPPGKPGGRRLRPELPDFWVAGRPALRGHGARGGSGVQVVEAGDEARPARRRVVKAAG